VLAEGVVEELWARAEADPTAAVTVDLEAREVRFDDRVVPFELDDFTRWRLLNGLDDIGLTLRHTDAVAAYEAGRPAFRPTTLPVQ
jgi:3-isopropylmalate/(R)-2-methylmalate dehydratase small subunit